MHVYLVTQQHHVQGHILVHYTWVSASDGVPFFSRKRILIHIFRVIDYTLIFIKHFLPVLEISKTFVFFLWASGEYWTRLGQGSVFKIRFQGSVVKTDPCPYLVKYSPDVLKNNTKDFDIFNKDKKCFIKINVESSPHGIGIRICFLENNGSPSLVSAVGSWSRIKNPVAPKPRFTVVNFN